MTLSKSILVLGYSVFRNCDSLLEIIIPSRSKFSNSLCGNLEKVVFIYSLVGTEARSVFYKCSKLNAVIYCGGLEEINEGNLDASSANDFAAYVKSVHVFAFGNILYMIITIKLLKVSQKKFLNANRAKVPQTII